jgi:ribosomal protein S18 acetylase RimI-like enzyme
MTATIVSRMTAASQPEILDLRHFSASALRPLLEQESRLWADRLRWDYRNSIELLLSYFDQRSLPGYVALTQGKVTGYVFCVYEGPKAIVGGAFASPIPTPGPVLAPLPGSSADHASEFSANPPAASPRDTEILLLRHLLETLQHSPQIHRIESQLLLHPAGALSSAFTSAGFQSHRRLLLELDLENPAVAAQPRDVPRRSNLVMRRWEDSDFHHSAALVHQAYQGHIDAHINDQYRTIAGAERFLHNIIRFPGCGFFDAGASRVVVQANSGEMVGLLLCSRVRSDIAHITQLCVAPGFRGQGVAHAMLDANQAHLHYQRFAAITLTVTEQNLAAVDLYSQRGLQLRHDFEAFVWDSPVAEK